MTKLSRRQFTGGMLAGSAALAMPSLAFGATPRVVVIGGGAGGATAARYIACLLYTSPSPRDRG